MQSCSIKPILRRFYGFKADWDNPIISDGILPVSESGYIWNRWLSQRTIKRAWDLNVHGVGLPESYISSTCRDISPPLSCGSADGRDGSGRALIKRRQWAFWLIPSRSLSPPHTHRHTHKQSKLPSHTTAISSNRKVNNRWFRMSFVFCCIWYLKVFKCFDFLNISSLNSSPSLPHRM